MNRTFAIFAIAILGLAGPAPASSEASETLASRFAAVSAGQRTAGALDRDDPRHAARLFASNGEYARAYDALGEAFDDNASPEDEDLRTRLLIALGRYQAADSALALRPHVRDRHQFYLHQLRRARVNALSGRDDRALDLLLRLDGLSYEEVDPYRDFLLVDVLVRSGRPDHAVAVAAKRFAAGFPRSLTPAFETRMLDGLLAAGRPADALALLDTLQTRAAQKSALAPVLAREVDVRFALGDTLGAVRAVRVFLESYGAVRALAPVETVVTRGDPSLFENAAVLDFAEVFVANRRISKAEGLLSVLEGRVVDTTGTERVRLLRSEISYRGGRYAETARRAERAFADPALERRAKLLRARAYRGAGEKTKAARAYNAFASAYPYDAKAPEALYVAWDLYREEKNPNAAAMLGKIVETYPENKYARIATRRIALDHIERRRYTEGARVLEDALRRWGREDEALLYYLASVYARQGRKAEERKVMEEIAAADSFSFYIDPVIEREFVLPASRGETDEAEGAGADFREFLECVAGRRGAARDGLSREVAPWPPDEDFGDAGEYLARGLIFLDMGFRDWAEAELRVFESWKGLPPRALLALSAVYDEYGLASRSVRAIQRVRDRFSGRERLRLDHWFRPLSFPAPFPGAVTENCGRFGMAPHLVYAMMREESRFDEQAVSGAGARGLMQLMPATAKELAGKLGFPEGEARDLFSPDFNVAVGVFYASELLAESKGDPLMMLAGYNAGFSNARRWFEGARKGSSNAERVDSIDYWETCDYVKKIVESAHVYHDLYFSSREAANCK
jgi:soluble lytic murein transglycosylase